MKNEVLARAITGIDDDLIESAHQPAMLKRRVIKYFSAFAAACLVLVLGVLFLSRNNNEFEVLINGTDISLQPVSVMPQDTRQEDPAARVITIPLEIVSKGDLTITAIDGTIEAYSSKTNELICIGQFFKAKKSVTVWWIIDDTNTSQPCKLRVNDQELILKYEQATDKWTISKLED